MLIKKFPLLENKLFRREKKVINDAKFAQRVVCVFSFFFRHKTAVLILKALQHEEPQRHINFQRRIYE